MVTASKSWWPYKYNIMMITMWVSNAGLGDRHTLFYLLSFSGAENATNLRHVLQAHNTVCLQYVISECIIVNVAAIPFSFTVIEVHNNS